MERVEELKSAANLAIAKSDFAGAARNLTEAISLAPKQKELYSNRAFVFSALGKHEEALADAKHCIATSPAFSKGYLRAGRALIGLGRWAEAVGLLEDASDRMPQDYSLQEALGDAIAGVDAAPIALASSCTQLHSTAAKDGGLSSSYYYAAVGELQRKLPVAPPPKIDNNNSGGLADVKAVANGAIREDIDRKGSDSYYYAHDRNIDYTVPTVPMRLNPDGSLTPWHKETKDVEDLRCRSNTIF